MSVRSGFYLAVLLFVAVSAVGVVVWQTSKPLPSVRLADVHVSPVSPLAGRNRPLASLLPTPPALPERAVVQLEAQEVNLPPPPPAEPTLTPDRLKLGALATNYIYRGYAQLGQLRTGKLEDNRHAAGVRIISVTEGEYVEEDMFVQSLSPERCVMALGDATYELPMVGMEIEELLKSLQENPRELTEEEKRLAMLRYDARWAAKIREYQLRHPNPNPRRELTPEEEAANRVAYWEKYGKENRERYEKYIQMNPEAAAEMAVFRYGFDGPSPEEQRASLNEYLDAKELEYETKIPPERRKALEAKIIRQHYPADPAKWATPYPGYEQSQSHE